MQPFRLSMHILRGLGRTCRAWCGFPSGERGPSAVLLVSDPCFRNRRRIALVCGPARSHILQCHQEVADHLMRTSLPAEMLVAGGQDVDRVPSTDAQFSRFFADDEPMIGLALPRSADIACYDLLDHFRSPFQREAKQPKRMASTVTIPTQCFMHPRSLSRTHDR